MTDAQRSLYCFGLGYSALQLADRLLALGWRVGGTVRTSEKADGLKDRGIAAETFQNHAMPPPDSDWLISIPPSEAGCPAFLSAGHGADTARSITYLSTTGVYGDLGGRWAYEWSPVNPLSDRARNRVIAEDQWRGTGRRLSIVRLPGIYGPGRSSLDRVREGNARRIVKPGQVFSRVHVDDIASGLEAILLREAQGVFHLTDDEPCPPQDVTAYAAEILGAPVPADEPFESVALSPMAASFYAECKRVANGRTKAALGWRPTYPTYREGLRHILETGG
ncbi:MAG: SDR family NAD(P)-dependent oxidoreductase [Pseudomonadota bacterium]